MAIYINENRKIKSIFASVNNEKKSIVSAWVNKDGTPTKVFALDRGIVDPVDPYEVAAEGENNNWKYILDDENNIITLQKYINTVVTDIIVYANYIVNGKIYKTQLANFGYPGSGGYSYSYMFGAKNKIETINFSNGIDTSNVTNMTEMFRDCTSLIKLDLSIFDTFNVTKMNYMFSGCESLQNINLNSFDTSNVISMKEMFYDCYSLTELDLSSFDTNNVTIMDSMFAGTYNLKTIYVTDRKWSTSNATTVRMFSGCGTSAVTYK